MPDLVDRLREVNPHYDPGTCWELLKEAADEIERMRRDRASGGQRGEREETPRRRTPPPGQS